MSSNTNTLAPLSASAQQILAKFKLVTTIQTQQTCHCGDQVCDITLDNSNNVPFSLEVYGNDELNLYVLRHQLFSAIISDQGGQLISWQPQSQKHDCIFMSDLDLYKKGTALRGGVPVCYPWFGKVANPAHGTARVSIWTQQVCKVTADTVEFSQYFNNNASPSAKLTYSFSLDQLTLSLEALELNKSASVTVNDTTIPVTAAFHTYFNISDVEDIRTVGLPKQSVPAILEKFSGITTDADFSNQYQVSDAVKIGGFVDNVCAFTEQDATPVTHTIYDPQFSRKIEIVQEQATDCVFWNPWNTKVSALSDSAYRHMLCLETARINRGFTATDNKLVGTYKVSKL